MADILARPSTLSVGRSSQSMDLRVALRFASSNQMLCSAETLRLATLAQDDMEKTFALPRSAGLAQARDQHLAGRLPA